MDNSGPCGFEWGQLQGTGHCDGDGVVPQVSSGKHPWRLGDGIQAKLDLELTHGIGLPFWP